MIQFGIQIVEHQCVRLAVPEEPAAEVPAGKRGSPERSAARSPRDRSSPRRDPRAAGARRFRDPLPISACCSPCPDRFATRRFARRRRARTQDSRRSGGADRGSVRRTRSAHRRSRRAPAAPRYPVPASSTESGGGVRSHRGSTFPNTNVTSRARKFSTMRRSHVGDGSTSSSVRARSSPVRRDERRYSERSSCLAEFRRGTQPGSGPRRERRRQ